MITWKIPGESHAGLSRNEEPSLKPVKATWSHEIISPSSPPSIINSNEALAIIEHNSMYLKDQRTTFCPNKEINPAPTEEEGSILLSKPTPRV